MSLHAKHTIYTIGHSTHRLDDFIKMLQTTETNPQYEIKSDKTDHIAAHKGSALTKI